jgi:DNA-binding GntR family transcriptional regulator
MKAGIPMIQRRTPQYVTATEHAFQVLKEWVNHGALAPGTVLDQVEMSRALGVSRVPVRMAFERLASEGFITLTPHKSAVVREISLQEMRDVYVVRHRLEQLAMELAAGQLSVEDQQQLDDILIETTACLLNGDVEGFLACNRRFHMQIYQASANGTLMHVIGNLWDLSERYRRTYLQLPGRAQQSTEEHYHLSGLLKQRRRDEAVAFLQKHNEATLGALADRFGGLSSEELP